MSRILIAVILPALTGCLCCTERHSDTGNAAHGQGTIDTESKAVIGCTGDGRYAQARSPEELVRKSTQPIQEIAFSLPVVLIHKQVPVADAYVNIVPRLSMRRISARSLFTRVSPESNRVQRSGPGGEVVVSTHCRISGSSIVGFDVVAYHPVHGTAFDAIPKSTITQSNQAPGPLVMELKTRNAATGVVTFSSGKPASGVRVFVAGSFARKSSPVNCRGLWCFTDKEGKFRIPGIPDGTQPLVLTIRYSPGEAPDTSDVEAKKVLSDASFNPGSRTWDFGVVTLPQSCSEESVLRN